MKIALEAQTMADSVAAADALVEESMLARDCFKEMRSRLLEMLEDKWDPMIGD